MSVKRKLPVEDTEQTEAGQFCCSEPIEDRSSKFIAYYSPTVKPKELQQLPAAASASHKILAWRRESNQQSITKALQYVTGSDDDGEKYAGKRVEKVMETMQVSGACVVARWYGGVMLGPVRFNHIEACARDAIRKWQEQQQEAQHKKLKLEEEAQEILDHVEALPERDRSIGVLRKLAADKEASLKAASQNVGSSPSSTHATPTSSSGTAVNSAIPNYQDMSIERLRALDKARDATIAFLLKRIDKAEAEITAMNREATKSDGDGP